MIHGDTMAPTAKLLLVGTVLLCLYSCMTAPKNIPENATVEELTLLGQQSLDISNYKAAEVYYSTIIKRFGSDITVLVAAEYEIAHIRVKQKKWDEADEMLKRIVSYYEGTEAGLLPPHYKKLALIDLDKIPQGDN